MLPPGSRGTKIKPPRKSISSSSVLNANNQPFDFEKSWEVLSNAIVQIQNKNVSNLSYEQLYRKGYTLVLHKFGGKLYENVKVSIQNHLLTRRNHLLTIFQNNELNNNSIIEKSLLFEEYFFKTILNEWNEHLQSMKFISDVLMYLNRVYVREQNKLLIYDLGIQLFKDFIIKYNNNELGDKLINILINEITKNRKGEIISTKMYIDKIIGMFELLHENNNLTDLNVVENYYQKAFEPVYLSNSEIFFKDLSNEFLTYENSYKYLIETNQFITDEINRINFYLPETTVPRLISLMNNILIKNQLDKVINLPHDALGHWIQLITENVLNGTKEINMDEKSQTLSISGSLINFDQLNYLKILYRLNSKIDNNCELLKIRLKDLIINQGKQFPLLIKNLLNSSENTKSSTNSNTKKLQVGINSPAFANRWIELILSYKNQFSIIVKEAFNHDYSMEQYITSAVKEFINVSTKLKQKSNPQELLIVNPSEALSIYMDYNIKQLLRPNSSNMKSLNNSVVSNGKIKSRDSSNNQNSNDSLSLVDDFLNKSIQFLRFINDKDAFEAFYKNHFAKRFLNSKGFNTINSNLGIDIEELIISKLSEELGTTSLDNIIKMNLDIKLSRDITSEWKRHILESNDKSIIEMDLKICNVSYWPNSMTKDYKKLSGKDLDNNNSLDGITMKGSTNDVNEDKVIWPRYLKNTIIQFEEFWSEGKKNDNKSLYWSPKFGSMDLKISYPSKTYEINLSTYAGIIMLLFGPSTKNAIDDLDYKLPFVDKRRLSYREIKELTGIPETDLKRHLQSIAVAPRLRLLVKIPMTKEVNEDDIFELNDKFKSPSIKVKVLTVSATSSSNNSSSANGKVKKSSHDEELDEIEANISEGRKHEINAAIVRILKSRQSIIHRELVSEIVKQLQSRFIPNNILIKRQLEDLIDKEYLKRDEEDRNLFHYIA